MFDLIINDDSDRELLRKLDGADRDALLMKRIHAMALDVSKLVAAVDRNTKAVDALLASHSDPAAQAAVDAAAVALDAESQKAEDAVAPAPAA